MTNDFDRFNSWKTLVYSDRCEQIANGKMPKPANLSLYPSNICPYKCNFCIMSEEHKKHGKDMLSRETLERVVEDCSKNDIKLVHISGGGEPLTHPYINELLRNLNSKNIKIAMDTNGYLLSNLRTNVDHLRVSFNAGERGTYKGIHNVDGFDRVIENIKMAVEFKKGKDIGMAYVLTLQNYKEVNQFIDIAEDCGVDFVHIRPVFEPKTDKKLIDIIKHLEIKKSDKLDVFSISEKFDGYWNENKYSCMASPLHWVLTATGQFAICQDRLDITFGDYNKKSFDEIWYSKEHQEAIEKAQNCNIRCVECKSNEIIQKVFKENLIRKELI